MLIGPCARTTVGAATVAAAPAAATLRKRRRLDVLSVFDLAIVFSPFCDPRRISPFLLGEDKGVLRGLARKLSDHATLRRGSTPKARNAVLCLFLAGR